MAGGMKIDWHGAERLTMVIAGAGAKVNDQAGQVVKNNTEKLKTKTQKLAPKDTEFMADHIKSSFPAPLEGHVNGEAAYNGYQEYGTRFQPGKPHFRPALREVEPQFKKDMTDVMKGVFEE